MLLELFLSFLLIFLSAENTKLIDTLVGQKKYGVPRDHWSRPFGWNVKLDIFPHQRRHNQSRTLTHGVYCVYPALIDIYHRLFPSYQ